MPADMDKRFLIGFTFGFSVVRMVSRVSIIHPRPYCTVSHAACLSVFSSRLFSSMTA